MFESTTKEFEKLLLGETKKQRPYTHQNMRDSQKYLDSKSLLENNISRNQTFKNMGKNLVNNSTREVDSNNLLNTFGKKNNPNYLGQGANDSQVNTNSIKNDSIQGILEKYGEVKFDAKKDNLNFFGNNSKEAINNDSMVRQSLGLNEIMDKNEKRMNMLNNFEKQLNIKDSNKFDNDEQSKLVGNFNNNHSDYGSKHHIKNTGSMGLSENNSYGNKLAVSNEFNLGTLENQLNKYKDVKL